MTTYTQQAYITPDIPNGAQVYMTNDPQVYMMTGAQIYIPNNMTSTQVYIPNETQISTCEVDQLNQLRLQAFQDVCQKHEISDLFASKMRVLEGFKIVIVCDDSGSMNEIANSVTNYGNPYGHKATKWDELKATVGMIIDIAAVLSQDGVDIYFLNRAGLNNVTHRSQIEVCFEKKPAGGTPIVPILQQIFNHKIDGKRLVILATDGVPTDCRGQTDIRSFKDVLTHQRGIYDYVNIVACTDDESTMEYLNDWDVNIPRLDVIDDYGSEKEEILRAQGRHFSFSYGDYIVKCMLGSVDPWFDSLDERPINGTGGTMIGNRHNNKPDIACKCVLF